MHNHQSSTNNISKNSNHNHNHHNRDNNHNNSVSTLQNCNLTIKPCLVGSSTWRIKETALFLAITTYVSIGMAWSWTITIINTFLFQIWSQLLVASAALCQVLQSYQVFRSEGICLTICLPSVIIFELNLQNGSPLSPGDDEASWEAEPLREWEELLAVPCLPFFGFNYRVASVLQS